jgi:hypothetical protein
MNKTLEGCFADQKISAFLVTANLTKSDGTGTETVWLLNNTGRGSGLTSSLGGELFAGSLTAGRFTSGLFGTSHFRNQ